MLSALPLQNPSPFLCSRLPVSFPTVDSCDLKSVSYFSSQLPLLKESKWDADKQYKAASNVRPNEASAHMEQVLGNTVFQIPYSREVEEQVLQGNLFKELGLKESRGFRRAIEAVTGEVFGC